MSTDTTVSPLRQRMIEDMAARSLNRQTQRSHIQVCKRFAAWLERFDKPLMATGLPGHSSRYASAAKAEARAVIPAGFGRLARNSSVEPPPQALGARSRWTCCAEHPAGLD
jgi:hypothetical protein